MTTTASGQKLEAQGSARVHGDAVALAMTMTMPGIDGRIEVRIVDGFVYIVVPGATGGKFAKIDPDDASNPFAAAFTQAGGQTNPAAALRAVDGAVTSVEPVGAPVVIGGVPAQRYDVAVDTAKVGGSLGEAFKKAGAAVPKTVTYAYWLGPDNHIAKVVTSVGAATTQLTFTHWGHAAPVEAPAEDQITTESPF